METFVTEDDIQSLYDNVCFFFLFLFPATCSDLLRSEGYQPTSNSYWLLGLDPYSRERTLLEPNRYLPILH